MGRRRRRASSSRAVLLAACLAACGGRGEPAARPAEGWLARDADARRAQLERQLRGLDVAMMEVGHRYVDLYWAGQDRNWPLAAYELAKLRLAIENGLERRPKRAASARPFLAGPLAAMDEAVAARDPERFAVRFGELTAACNACHASERVSFFEVHTPEARISPIRSGAAPAQGGAP